MHHKPDSLEAIRRWDMVARALVDSDDWDGDEGDIHRIVLLNPALFQLLGDVDGQRVLDAGCGEGYLSRKLAKQGAHVTAVDFSKEMLAIADERTDRTLGIRYVHANCEDMSFLDAESFDVVVSNMVLMDLSDHSAALKSMHRVLVEGGDLVFSISHPGFTTPEHGWVRNEHGDRLYWKVDEYFSEGAYEMLPGIADGMLLFHRTLSSYLRMLLTTGFSLLDVIEPAPTEEMLRKYPEFGHHMRMSHFIVFKARKP